jgi:hypothetical protein
VDGPAVCRSRAVTCTTMMCKAVYENGYDSWPIERIVTSQGLMIPGYNGQPASWQTTCCENIAVEERNVSGLLT